MYKSEFTFAQVVLATLSQLGHQGHALPQTPNLDTVVMHTVGHCVASGQSLLIQPIAQQTKRQAFAIQARILTDSIVRMNRQFLAKIMPTLRCMHLILLAHDTHNCKTSWVKHAICNAHHMSKIKLRADTRSLAKNIYGLLRCCAHQSIELPVHIIKNFYDNIVTKVFSASTVLATWCTVRSFLVIQCTQNLNMVEAITNLYADTSSARLLNS